MLPDLPDPQSHQKAIQGNGFTARNRFQEERGGSIGKSFKPDEIVLGQAIEVGE